MTLFHTPVVPNESSLFAEKYMNHVTLRRDNYSSPKVFISRFYTVNQHYYSSVTMTPRSRYNINGARVYWNFDNLTYREFNKSQRSIAIIDRRAVNSGRYTRLCDKIEQYFPDIVWNRECPVYNISGESSTWRRKHFHIFRTLKLLLVNHRLVL